MNENGTKWAVPLNGQVTGSVFGAYCMPEKFLNSKCFCLLEIVCFFSCISRFKKAQLQPIDHYCTQTVECNCEECVCILHVNIINTCT